MFSSMPLASKPRSSPPINPKKLDLQLKIEETDKTRPDNTATDHTNETEAQTETAVIEPINVNYAAVAGSLKKLHKIMRNEPPSPIPPIEQKIEPVVEPKIEPAVPAVQEQRKKKKKCTIL
jgi:hypothetical protein